MRVWIAFNDDHPPIGPGNPFQIPTNYLKKQTPEEPAAVALQRRSCTLRDAALGIAVMHVASLLRQEAPTSTDDSHEHLSSEGDGSVQNSPECNGGFEGIVIQDLWDVPALLGIDGGVVLDTRVLHHASPFAPRPYEHDLFVAIGGRNVPITLSDIARADVYLA